MWTIHDPYNIINFNGVKFEIAHSSDDLYQYIVYYFWFLAKTSLSDEVNSVVSDAIHLVHACQRLDGDDGKALPQIETEIERYITDLKAAIATDTLKDT